MSRERLVLRTVYLPEQLDKKLKKYAFRRDRSKNDLIRQLITVGLGKLVDGTVTASGGAVSVNRPIVKSRIAKTVKSGKPKGTVRRSTGATAAARTVAG